MRAPKKSEMIFYATLVVLFVIWASWRLDLHERRRNELYVPNIINIKPEGSDIKVSEHIKNIYLRKWDIININENRRKAVLTGLQHTKPVEITFDIIFDDGYLVRMNKLSYLK